MIKWHTYDMGGARAEKTPKAHLSHAVDQVGKVLCGKVKTGSLCMDNSLNKPGVLPDCPACRRVIEGIEKLGVSEAV